MGEKVVVFQDSNFESFAKMAESIVQDAVDSRPKEVVAVRTQWGGSKLKLKEVGVSAERAALAKFAKLNQR